MVINSLLTFMPMKISKQVFNFYINSSIHVAFSAFSLSWITLIEYDLPVDWPILLFVFFATIVGYNFVKYFGLARFHYIRLDGRLKWIQLFSLCCVFAMCYFMLQLRSMVFLYVLLLGAITFLYAIPMLPRRFFLDGKQNLRSIGGLKVYLISLVWTGVTVFLPLVNNGYNIDSHVLLTALQRYAFITVLMLPFEIRDLQFDSIKLATIPQKIGQKQTKIMGLILLLVVVLIEFVMAGSTSLNSIILTTMVVLTLFLLLGATKKQDKYYSAFWVEGIPIIWLALLLIFT